MGSLPLLYSLRSQAVGPLKHGHPLWWKAAPLFTTRTGMHSCRQLGTQSRGGAHCGGPPTGPPPQLSLASLRVGPEETEAGKGGPGCQRRGRAGVSQPLSPRAGGGKAGESRSAPRRPGFWPVRSGARGQGGAAVSTAPRGRPGRNGPQRPPRPRP